MELYLAIMWTYLSIVMSLLLIMVNIQQKIYKEDKAQIWEDNQKWKEEVRNMITGLRKSIYKK